MSVVEVRDLRKTFKVHTRAEGLRAALRSVARRTFREVPAVAGIDFTIEAGEIVGFLGPNGAGKTTTLKMLSGVLYPTSGEARVLGYVPWERKHDYLRRMTLLMGNRTQLWWDIPAADSLRTLQEIYRVPDDLYRRTLDDLTDLLDLGPLLHKPVRQLSLGERMKAEFAAALLHKPEVAFMDEPTIGLDVSMQARIREFIRQYNERMGATILLTSHYMDDILALCRRVIVIHRGRLLYDGVLADLTLRMAPYKVVGVTLHDDPDGRVDLSTYGELVRREARRLVLRVPRERAASVAARLVAELGERLADLTLEDPPLEEVIDRVFSAEEPVR